MFALLEKDVSERALEAVVSFVGALENKGIDTETIWADAYVVGLLSGIVANTVSIFSRHRIEDEVMNSTIVHVLADVSELNRLDMGRLIVEHQQLSAPDFVRGTENASKMLVFFYNPFAYADDPDIVRARSIATNMNSIINNAAETAEQHAVVCRILAENILLDKVHSNLI